MSDTLTTNISRLAAFLAVVAAMVAGGLAQAEPAAAHSADALHQHGWSSLRLMYGSPFRCTNSSQMFTYVVPGDVNLELPDLVTTPGGTQYVYFTARLEYYNFGAKQWVETGEPKPWLRTLTNGNGPALSWREVDANWNEVRYAPRALSWSVTSGYYYRIHQYYYWGYDGTKFYDDATGYCYVA